MVSYIDDQFEASKFDEASIKVYDEISQFYANTSLTEYDVFDKFDQLLQKYQNHYLIYYFMGNYYKEHFKYDESISCYRICLSKSKFMDSYLNLSIVYQIIGNLKMAEIYLKKALEIHPSDLRIINNLGVTYYMEKDYYKAHEYYTQVMQNHKGDEGSLKMVCNNIGFTCSAIGRGYEAIKYFDRGLNIKSKNDDKLNVQLLQNKLLNYDYIFTLPKDTFNDYLLINKFLETNSIPFICSKTKNKKLKIGYVSPDFRNHVVTFFMEPILRLQNKNLFEIYCYANMLHEDSMSQKLKGYVKNWFNIFQMSDDEASQLIYSHKIDILIDLAGHTNNNRLGIFARKPAYIQMTYLGFPNTTGLKTIDYRITDKIADPPNTKQKYTEELIYMPRCFICFNSFENLSNLPIKLKNPNDHIIFAVINKIQKHNFDTFEVWNKILDQCPNSVIKIKKDIKSQVSIDDMYKEQIHTSPGRIQMLEHITDYTEHLLNHNNIDICLDTFPYSGTTTSCCSLLMGTPIITLHISNRHVSNVTESILKNMGFPELVANSKEEYVKIAVELAGNKERINYYKQNIRTKFLEVMNENRFIQEFDQLIYQTYQKYF